MNKTDFARLAQSNPELVDLNPHHFDASAKRRIAGAIAQSAGAAFQAEIAAQFERLSAQRFTLIFETGPHTKVVGRNDDGSLRIVHTGKGPPDFVGLLAGRPLAVEAKSTTEQDAWTVPTERMHQYEFMADMLACASDSIAGYLIEWRNANEVRWHPLDGTRYERTDGLVLADRQIIGMVPVVAQFLDDDDNADNWLARTVYDYGEEDE